MKLLMKDQEILLQQEAENWEEAIRKVAAPLREENIIEEAYITAMIDKVKEYGAYIVIGPHLALAHARPEEGVIKAGLSVATFKNPVNFGSPENDPVKIIFCLAARDSNSHLELIRELIALINNEDKIEQLAQVKEVNEFRALLMKKQ